MNYEKEYKKLSILFTASTYERNEDYDLLIYLRKVHKSLKSYCLEREDKIKSLQADFEKFYMTLEDKHREKCDFSSHDNQETIQTCAKVLQTKGTQTTNNFVKIKKYNKLKSKLKEIFQKSRIISQKALNLNQDLEHKQMELEDKAYHIERCEWQLNSYRKLLQKSKDNLLSAISEANQSSALQKSLKSELRKQINYNQTFRSYINYLKNRLEESSKKKLLHEESLSLVCDTTRENVPYKPSMCWFE